MSMSSAGNIPNGSDLLSDFLTEPQFGQLIGRDIRTLRRWHARHEGPPRIKVGRSIFYRKSSVVEWLASHEQRTRRTK
jgi:predicted DNA-binding transcriptional regulator AlpA